MQKPIPIGFDTSTLDPEETVRQALGGVSGPLDIEIDEILVTSTWRPNNYLADKYISEKGRVFLSGDAAHQNIPTGGYGMNTAVGDSFDIGWKVAAVIKGYGGDALLHSYEEERRPVAARNIDQSGLHFSVIMKNSEIASQGDVRADDEQGRKLRAEISKNISENDAENKAHGLEMGYRYNQSSVVNHEQEDVSEPEWKLFNYVPSTWPGVRSPHVFLNDGTTSIFDLFGNGPQYTLVDFSADGSYLRAMKPIAESLGMPLKSVHIPDEKHARAVWERDAVLVRPDYHVSWRAPLSASVDTLDIENILLIALGKRADTNISRGLGKYASKRWTNGTSFASTVGNVDNNKVEGLGVFQQ